MATVKKLKKLIINGESYNLPNNSDFVDLSSAQSVGWVKTFTSEPVLPSKTSSATNDGTKPATEAQVYKKQDTLVSWTNIKTVKNTSLLGSWDISISEFTPWSWTTWQILRKTASWYEWSDEVGQVYTAWTNVDITNNVISATDTTYSEVSKSDMDTWTATTAWVVSAKSIADYVSGRIGSAVNYKGQVNDYASLPASPSTWDMYNVVAAHTSAPKFDAGTNVVWNGTSWDPMAEMVDLSNLVDKTTNQTIGGVKTFSSEPVLPSKSTSAGSSKTAPANEYQVSLKQDTLIAWSNIQIANDGKTISATDTTYESKSASSWGTAVSLVTTWEKYTWNNKADTSDIGNGTISVTQGGVSAWSFSTNQSSNGSLALHDNIVKTQTEYNNLPSSKSSDWNSYWIYESVSS